MNDPYFAQDDEFGLIGACLTGSIDTCSDAFAEVKSEWIETDSLRDTYETIKSFGSSQPESNPPRTWKGVGARFTATSQSRLKTGIKAMEVCPSPANLPYYTKGVIEAAHRRPTAARWRPLDP